MLRLALSAVVAWPLAIAHECAAARHVAGAAVVRTVHRGADPVADVETLDSGIDGAWRARRHCGAPARQDRAGMAAMSMCRMLGSLRRPCQARVVLQRADVASTWQCCRGGTTLLGQFARWVLPATSPLLRRVRTCTAGVRVTAAMPQAPHTHSTHTHVADASQPAVAALCVTSEDELNTHTRRWKRSRVLCR